MTDTMIADSVTTAIDMKAISAVIAADIATRFGQTVTAEPTDVSHKGEESYATLDIEQNFGAFKMVITTAELRLRASPCSDGTTWVSVSLRYQHVGGGSNGSTVGTWWLREGVIDNFRAG